MRKVILSMHITLDGFISGPNGEMDWASMSEEMDDGMLPELMDRADTCLIGRSLYQGFASYWPNAQANNPGLSKSEVDFSGWIERVHKVVFSTTLDKAEWNNSRLVRADLVGEVKRLKQQPGKDMVMFGGVRIARDFVRLGLVDEFDLLLNPIILAKGEPLFKDVSVQQKLKLVFSRSFGNKAISLRYIKEEDVSG